MSAQNSARRERTQAVTACYYFDRIRFWLDKKLSKGQIRELRAVLGQRFIISTKRMKYRPRYCQRVDVLQPAASEIRLLGKVITAGYVINYVEAARDECVPSGSDLVELLAFRNEHEIRLWHPKDQDIVHYEATHYDARRGKPRVLTRYIDAHCRVTGELHCLHTEIRLSGTQAVQRAGIKSFDDLLKFDHRAWWAKKTKLVTINDVERLGRAIRNADDGTRDSKAKEEKWGSLTVNVDARTGSLVLRASNSYQHLLDKVSRYGNEGLKRAVRGSLHRLDQSSKSLALNGTAGC